MAEEGSLAESHQGAGPTVTLVIHRPQMRGWAEAWLRTQTPEKGQRRPLRFVIDQTRPIGSQVPEP